MKFRIIYRFDSNKWPIIVGLTVLILGWCSMRFLWEVWYKNAYSGYRTLPYYLSANWGDLIILPILSALLIRELYPFSKITAVKKKAIVASLLGLIGGATSQVSWLADESTLSNWTFNEAGGFNFAGWYHAVFLVFMCGALFGGLGALLSLGRTRDRWERGSVLTHLAIGYLLVLFTCLLATDNRRPNLLSLSVTFLDWLELSIMPLFCSFLICVAGYYLRAPRRLLFVYLAVLSSTSLSVPLALAVRVPHSVSSVELVYCAGAVVFAANFVTSPAFSSLTEQYLRSIPAVVVSYVFTLLIVTPPFLGAHYFVPIVAVCALLVTSIISTSVCVYDSPPREALNTLIGASLLVLLSVMAALVSGGNSAVARVFSASAPLIVLLMCGRWVIDNFDVVKNQEAGAAAEGSRGKSDLLRGQRLLRYKVLIGFLIYAAIVTVFNIWNKVQGMPETPWMASWRYSSSLILVLLMAGVSYIFSWLSLRNNVYVLRGLSIGRCSRIRCHVTAAVVAIISLAYGAGLAVFSSTRISILQWLLGSAGYLLLIAIVCGVALRGIDGVRHAEWPCVSSPSHGVLQDHMLSLMLFNSLGLGLPIWISDRFVTFFDSVLIFLSVMTPFAALFLFFLRNNSSHFRRQAEAVRCRLAADPSVDSERAELYLGALKKHCIYQNRVMVIAAILALPVVFLFNVALELGGLQDAERSQGFMNLIGGEGWGTLPSLAESIAPK